LYDSNGNIISLEKVKPILLRPSNKDILQLLSEKCASSLTELRIPLAEEKKLTTAIPKPYWQSGWLKQHDRLMTSLSSNKSRTPLVISGDMHSIALGSMMRSGSNDFSSNPVNVALSGTGGTYRGGWPSSGRRKTPAMTSGVLDFKEEIKPIEQHGFTLVDFTKDKMVLSFFKWDVDTQTIEDIDNLQPFHVKQLPRA
jgi:phosphodiesterase/alkaline phosphatase D-like protein